MSIGVRSFTLLRNTTHIRTLSHFGTRSPDRFPPTSTKILFAFNSTRKMATSASDQYPQVRESLKQVKTTLRDLSQELQRKEVRFHISLLTKANSRCCKQNQTS